MSYVLVYLNLSSFFKRYTNMQQHIILLADALFNIHTNPATLHIQRKLENGAQFNISLKIFSYTMGKPCEKCRFSAQNICNSFEKAYLSRALYTTALYTLTLIDQIKAKIVLVCQNLVALVSNVPIMCSAARVCNTFAVVEHVARKLAIISGQMPAASTLPINREILFTIVSHNRLYTYIYINEVKELTIN